MRRVIVSVLSLLAVAAPAQSAFAGELRQDGETYHYATQTKPNGVILLTGSIEESGDQFALRVKGRNVSGYMAGQPVSFVVSRETADALVAETATGQKLASN